MNLRDVLSRQQAILADLEAQVTAYEASDLFTENIALKTQVDHLTQNNKALAKSVSQLKEQNTHLTQALYAHADRERSLFTGKSKERLLIYFGQAGKSIQDNLSALETDILVRTNRLLDEMKRSNVDASNQLYQQIQDFQQESQAAIQEAKATMPELALTNTEKAAYDHLETKPLTREQIIALAKKYSIERFVGLNLISTIGIILIIIAAIFVGQFIVVRMTDTQRAIGIFALGGAMLVAGEFFNRRKASVLSLVITAGGIAILYVALAFSYFALDILEMIPALIICVAITGVAFVLSTRYRAQVILIMAFVGGHLPFFAINMESALVYGFMAYILILNLLVLLVSFKMKWTLSAFIGLGFNIVAVMGVLILGSRSTSPFVLTGFIFLAFANYMAVPIIGTYVTKVRFTAADAVIMGINTIASCLIMYFAFLEFGWHDFLGLLALIYTVAYFALALVLWKKFEGANTMRDLAALTGFVFFVLIIPFQFDVIWLSLGWLLQGVALSLYGIIKVNPRVRGAGLTIFGLCVLIFLAIDITEIDGLHFGLRYLSVTVGSLLILGAFIYKKTSFTLALSIYNTFVLTNVWVYLIYLVSHLTDRLDWAYPLSAFYLMMAAQAVVAWGLAFCLARIKVLFDGGTLLLVVVLYITGIVGLFILNMTSYLNLVPIGVGTGSPGVTIGTTAVIVVVSGLSIFSLYDIVKYFVARAKLQPAYLHVIITVYALVIVTQNILVHYDVGFTNIWLSVFFIATALGWIIYGFAMGHTLLRRNGLGLVLLSVAKVFLLDLMGLSLEQRIASFFVMGALLVGIGFLYQYFSKRLEVRLELPEEEE